MKQHHLQSRYGGSHLRQLWSNSSKLVSCSKAEETHNRNQVFRWRLSITDSISVYKDIHGVSRLGVPPNAESCRARTGGPKRSTAGPSGDDSPSGASKWEAAVDKCSNVKCWGLRISGVQILSIYLSLSINQSINQSIYLSIYLSTCKYVCIYTYVHACMYVCVCIYVYL